MNSHEQTFDLLNQVTKQQQDMQKAVKNIRSMKYRTFGRNKVAVSDDQRKQMIHAVVTQCNHKCSALYSKINQEKLKAGLPELQNPYKD